MIPRHTDVRAIMAPGPAVDLSGEHGPSSSQEALTILETALYRQLYVRPQPVADAPPSSPSQRRDFIHALSSANAGRGCWENGWEIVERGATESVVSRGDLRFWVPHCDLRFTPAEPIARRSCSVFIGKEMRHLVPGFYMALGDHDSHLVPGEHGGVKPIVRLYWHLRNAGAVPYLGAATSVLNAGGVPFRTKVVADPGAYMRADAGVLYILKEDFTRAAPMLAEVHARISPWLRVDVPMFTKRLRDGLGLAENPAGGLSFGQSRCRIAAAALWACHREGVIEADARAAVFGRFAEAAGLDADLPFLEAGSADDYTL